LIVVHDDLDVPPGRVKLVWDGGAGGHRGVLSVMNALGSAEFYRVKMGIGRPPPEMAAEDFVLLPLQPEELEEVAGLVDLAAQAVKTLVTEGLAAAQNRFHRAD